MPNHCETDMYIRGPQEKVDEFAKWLEEIEPQERDICRVLLPYPEPFKTMDEEARVFAWDAQTDEATRKAALEVYQAKYGHTKNGYNSGGYEWCKQNWGTKWGIYEVDFTPDAGKRGSLLSFRSAWSPPANRVFQALSEKFPDLTFEIEYFEGGAAYCGGATFHAKAECEDYECTFGEPTQVWSGEYGGSRGGLDDLRILR